MRSHMLRAAGEGTYSPVWTMPEGDLDYWDWVYSTDPPADPAYTGPFLLNGEITATQCKALDGGDGYDNIIVRGEKYLSAADFGLDNFDDIDHFEMAYGMYTDALYVSDDTRAPMLSVTMQVYAEQTDTGSPRDLRVDHRYTSVQLGDKTASFELDPEDNFIFIRWTNSYRRTDARQIFSLGKTTITAIFKTQVEP